MITIVLADDHRVIRQGLRSLLEVEPDLKVLAEAGDGQEALNAVDELHPDILVLDMVMPGMNGVEVARRLQKQASRCGVVILSMYGAEGYVREAMQSGARAYVLKKDSAGELVVAIREAHAGRKYISPSLARKAIDSYLGGSGGRADPYGSLTVREREVLQMVATGSTSAQIAEKLSISRRTVEFHRANITNKLGIENLQELVRYCIEAGILPPEG